MEEKRSQKGYKESGETLLAATEENGKEWDGRRERGRERRRCCGAPTILINPVPDTQSRSRSNRVHDLQGIYIRSSTRGYNSIPSLYSAFERSPLTGDRWGRTHIIPLPTLPLSRPRSKMVASLLAPRQDLSAGSYCSSCGM